MNAAPPKSELLQRCGGQPTPRGAGQEGALPPQRAAVLCYGAPWRRLRPIPPRVPVSAPGALSGLCGPWRSASPTAPRFVGRTPTDCVEGATCGVLEKCVTFVFRTRAGNGNRFANDTACGQKGVCGVKSAAAHRCTQLSCCPLHRWYASLRAARPASSKGLIKLRPGVIT